MEFDTSELYLRTSLPIGKQRQMVIDRVTATLLLESFTEEEALSMFLWNLSDIDPPVSYDEQLFFGACYRMLHSFSSSSVTNIEEAFDILNITKDKLLLPPKEKAKEAKIAFWQQFNQLAKNAKCFFNNAQEIGIKKRAFYFLRNSAT